MKIHACAAVLAASVAAAAAAGAAETHLALVNLSRQSVMIGELVANGARCADCAGRTVSAGAATLIPLGENGRVDLLAFGAAGRDPMRLEAQDHGVALQGSIMDGIDAEFEYVRDSFDKTEPNLFVVRIYDDESELRRAEPKPERPAVVADQCPDYPAKLRDCVPHTCAFTHPFSGRPTERRILGIENGGCRFEEDTPNPALTMRCTIATGEPLQRVAGFYRTMAEAKSITGEVRVEMKPEVDAQGAKVENPGSTTTGANGKLVDNPLQEAMDAKRCDFVGAGASQPEQPADKAPRPTVLAFANLSSQDLVVTEVQAGGKICADCAPEAIPAGGITVIVPPAAETLAATFGVPGRPQMALETEPGARGMDGGVGDGVHVSWELMDGRMFNVGPRLFVLLVVDDDEERRAHKILPKSDPSAIAHQTAVPAAPQTAALAAVDSVKADDLRGFGADGDGRVFLLDGAGQRVVRIDAKGKVDAEFAIEAEGEIVGLAVEDHGQFAVVLRHGGRTRMAIYDDKGRMWRRGVQDMPEGHEAPFHLTRSDLWAKGVGGEAFYPVTHPEEGERERQRLHGHPRLPRKQGAIGVSIRNERSALIELFDYKVVGRSVETLVDRTVVETPMPITGVVQRQQPWGDDIVVVLGTAPAAGRRGYLALKLDSELRMLAAISFDATGVVPPTRELAVDGGGRILQLAPGETGLRVLVHTFP